MASSEHNLSSTGHTWRAYTMLSHSSSTTRNKKSGNHHLLQPKFNGKKREIWREAINKKP